MSSDIELHFRFEDEIVDQMYRDEHRSLHSFFKLHPAPDRLSQDRRKERFEYIRYFRSRREHLSVDLSQRQTAPPAASDLEHRLLKTVPSGFLDFYRASGIEANAGVGFEIDENDDLSGIGASIRWLHPVEIWDEITGFFPGRAAITKGMVPCGACLLGSGDLLFLRKERPEDDRWSLVRVAHDSIGIEDEGFSFDVEVVKNDVLSVL